MICCVTFGFVIVKGRKLAAIKANIVSGMFLSRELPSFLVCTLFLFYKNIEAEICESLRINCFKNLPEAEILKQI